MERKIKHKKNKFSIEDFYDTKAIEDLKDILEMRESLSKPEKEAVTLEDYERKRATCVSD